MAKNKTLQSVYFYSIHGSIKILQDLNERELAKVADDFAHYTEQIITPEIIDKFALTGLNNEDFLTSDFLNRYGLKNLLQFHQSPKILLEK